MTEKKLIKKMKKAEFVFKHSHPAGGLTFGYDASGFSFEVSVCPAAEKTKDAIERLGSVLSRLKKD